MCRSHWVRVLLLVGPVFVLWACGPSEESKPPFPVEDQTEWKRYLQGTWVYAGVSPSGSEIGVPVEDSLFLRVTFRGDSLDYVGETHRGDWVGKRKATCAVKYKEPYELEVGSCVRGLRLRRLEGDTLQSNRFSVSPGSPRSKKVAFHVGSVFPPSLRASSTDSLWMMEKGETDFYLTREQMPN